MNNVKNTLANYGASVNEFGNIVKGEKVLSVKVVVKSNRLRFEGMGQLIASGPNTEAFVNSFVKRFYNWSL